jgi:predicted amidophosphoribosyltransferase
MTLFSTPKGELEIMHEMLCPKCFRKLKSHTFTLVCHSCKQKWQVDWFDGVYQLGVIPLSMTKEK